MKIHRKSVELERYRDWLATPEEARTPLTKIGIARVLGVHITTLTNWDKELVKPRSAYNSDQFLADKTSIADAALLRACEKHNAQALRTYYQLTKRLIEQSEVKVLVLTADDIAKAYFEADRKLREGKFAVLEDRGMDSVSPKS